MSKVHFAYWVYLAVLVVGSFQIAQSQQIQDCEKLGRKCTLIAECRSAIELIKALALSNKAPVLSNSREERREAETLRNMFCGFNVKVPKVCCPIEDPIVFNNDTETATSRSKTTAITEVNVIEKNEANTIGLYKNLPSRKICGLNGSGTDRIVGGSIAAIDEFPWLARIYGTKKQTNNEENRKFTCAGSLITDRYVLTAAHCVLDRFNVGVRLGEWDAEVELDCYENQCSDPPIELNVSKIIIHPLYDKRIFDADIALLQLEKAVNFTEFVRPVCLPITNYTAKQDYVTGTTFWTAGWGTTELGTSSLIKRKVDLEAISIETCRNKFRELKRMNEQNIICAGGKVGKDTCNGDSGGSLVKEITEDFRTNWFLYGITSFGARRCGSTDTPSVYTRVLLYMDWIIKNVDL